MSIFKRIPVPLCAVALGMFGLGNLLQSYSEEVRLLCGAVAAVLLLLFLISVIVDFKKFLGEMKNPIMASVFCTFPMALMMLATYIKPYIGPPAKALWFVGIGLHVVLIVYFTLKFVLGFSLEKVFASWFIVYVGIAMAGITAPAFDGMAIGSACVKFGLAALAVLLILVTVRYLKKPVPKPAQPLICIYAAPTSLCIAGYVHSVTPKSLSLLMALWAVATLLFVFACVKFVQYIKLPFFPSYASFTFPFVISAIASKQLMACSANLGSPMPFLNTVVLIETVIAVCTTLYALARYLVFIFAGPKQPAR